MKIIFPDDETDLLKVKLLVAVESSLKLKVPESQKLDRLSNLPVNNTKNDKAINTFSISMLFLLS